MQSDSDSDSDSELADLDALETNLQSDHAGTSARKARAGTRLARDVLTRAHDKPLWRRQLKTYRAWRNPTHKKGLTRP